MRYRLFSNAIDILKEEGEEEAFSDNEKKGKEEDLEDVTLYNVPIDVDTIRRREPDLCTL